jgi:hypothetical protein
MQSFIQIIGVFISILFLGVIHNDYHVIALNIVPGSLPHTKIDIPAAAYLFLSNLLYIILQSILSILILF